MEAPLFKTLPDTHPVAWVQSEDSQQKWEGGGGEELQQRSQLSPVTVCICSRAGMSHVYAYCIIERLSASCFVSSLHSFLIV